MLMSSVRDIAMIKTKYHEMR